MTMFIAFGVTFEVPIAVILLVKSGMVTVQKLRAARGYVIVGAFIIAAVVTPPDVVSQFMLALPLCLLFELGVLVASALKNKVAQAQDDDSAEEDEAEEQAETQSEDDRSSDEIVSTSVR